MNASPDAQGSPTGTISMDTADADTYTIAGKTYARVTAVLKARGLINFYDIPEADRQFYMDRGTANHKLWQDIEEGVDGGFDYDKRVEAYRSAHAKFLRETGFKALPGGIEMRVKSDELGVAGTLDRIGTIQNRVVLIDYKTSAVHPATALQTALYLLCLPGYRFGEIERYGVAFKADGTYSMSLKYPFSDKAEAIWEVQQFNRGIK